jgi:tRNA 2-thiouridine synthesizing protein A
MNDPLTIDVRGLKCPLPVLKAAKRMAPLAPGARVVVLATDPMAAIDIPHFCNERGHRLLAHSVTGEEMRFEIEKGGPPDGR